MSDLGWLQALIAREGAAAGSVHRRVGDQLEATAFVGIPPPVQAVTAAMPLPHGMVAVTAWTGGGMPTKALSLALAGIFFVQYGIEN
ncbi:MAG: hypothetical protein KC549_05495, partial [Myxococcales bacterium]|nr:hypothetical protein [Myxococcales bacterium]